ncbi:hypothetical protein BC826DRAFT_995400 [Russula brevipes]|nr:hypothetical protein BC826DRAFT_995400 [Russula brevipes]
MPMGHPSRTVTLFCWVLGKGSSFPVDIEDSKTVGHLKEEILRKNSNGLPGIDAIDLKLWKVSIPVSKKLKDEVTEREYPDKDILETDLVSDIFLPPGPAQRTLHIVVQTPPSRECR